MSLKNYLGLFSIFFLTAPLSAVQSSATDDYQYPSFCLAAATDNNLYKNFRRTPIYVNVLEHVSYEIGRECLRIITKEYPHLMSLMDSFKKNDAIGNPNTGYYSEVGVIAPTTLRYIKIAGDIQKQFGNLDNATVIEIGGGFGGQCKILSDMYKFKRYIIVDLPGPLALTKRFLQEQNVQNVEFVCPDQISQIGTSDLVISNYAYSECTLEIQKMYAREILSKAKHGYCTCNVSPTRHDIFGTKQDLQAILSNNNIAWIELLERPLTGSNNYLIIW